MYGLSFTRAETQFRREKGLVPTGISFSFFPVGRRPLTLSLQIPNQNLFMLLKSTASSGRSSPASCWAKGFHSEN